MSTLTQETIERIAHLARIAISPSDIEFYTRNLSNIMSLIDELNSINTDGIAPMAHPLDIPQPMRKDKITETDQRALMQTLADPSAIKSGLYTVPKSVFKISTMPARNH